MPEAKKRTYSGVYDALNKVSQEEGIDFGLENYSPEDFKKKYFTGPGNISNLYNKLSQISDEEGIDFGLGTQDEWLASFGYRRRGDNDYETLDGKRVGGKSQQQVMSDAQQTLGENQRTINRISNRQQRIGLDTGPRVQIGGQGWQFGQNRKVTQGQQRFNPSTGQMEQTYITPSGNEYGTRGLADLEQNTIDQAEYDRAHPVDALSSRINNQIAELERKRESLMQSGMEQARQDLEKRGGIRGAIDRFLAGKRDVGPFGHTRAYAEQAARNKELATIETALKDLRDAQTRIERGKQLSASSDFLGGIGVPFTKDWFNNWKNFGYGIWDTMDDVAFNFFGNKDIDKASAYLRIKDKMESGKELTDTETSLALAGMAKAQAEDLVSLPHGYTAGETTLEMAPFMFQMAANPAGGMSRSLARQAVRQFGRNGLKAVTTRVLARGLGNLGEAAILSNTLQGGKTAADIAMRYSGDSFQFDDNGKLHMGYYEEGPDGKATFVDGGKSLLRSVYEGEASSIIENFTELGFGGNIGKAFGELFSKAAASKLGSKIGLEYISGLVSKIGSTPFAKSMKSFMERTHWDGMIEEPLEEEYGIILNSFLGTGDAKISDLWDSEKQADIFAGTMWFGGFMAGMNTAAYPIYRHGIKKQLQQADQNGQIAFGDEWEVMKDGIDMMDDKEVAKYLYSIKDNDAFSKEQKAALFAYTARLKQYQGAEVADMLSRMEGNLTEENATIRTSYDAGYDTEEPDDMKMIVDEADAAREQLQQYGNEFSIMVENGADNPANTLDYLMEHRDIFSDEQIAAAADYYQKQYRALGVLDAQSDKVDLEVERANAEVRSNTHQQSGNVVTATVNDEEVYVIGGEIVTDPNTGLASLAGTGGAVVVKNPVTGQISVKSPQEVVIQSVQNADDLIQQNETTLRQQLVQQADDSITFGSPANEVYDMEDQVSFQDGNGNVVNGMVVQLPNAVDGAYIIQTDDNKILQMTADDLNRRIVAHNGMQVERASAQPVQQQADEGVAQPAEQQGGTLDNAGGEAGAENGTGADNPPATAISRIPVATDEKGQPILKKGRPQYLWHQVSVEDAAAALIELAGGDKLIARDTATNSINAARERLEKIRKQKPKGEDPIEFIESRKAIKQQESEQQAIIKQWQKVNQLIQNMMQEESAARQAEAEAAKSEEQRQREAEEARIAKERQDEQDRKRLREQIEKDKERRNKQYEPLVQARKDMADDAEALATLGDTEPRSLDEFVSSLLRPHSMLWLDVSESEIGLQTELGLKRNDMQRMMSLLGTKESGAKPFGQVVLDIHEGLPQGMKEMYTDADVRNTLLDLFNEGSSTRMLHLTEEHRIEEARNIYAENKRREAEAELEAWAEAYHLTPEERETFEDFMQQAPSLPEQEIINQIIADNEQNRTSPAVGEQPVSGTDAGSIEGGEGQVQQAAEAAGNGNNAQAADQETEAATGQPSVADNDVPGRTQSVDREALRELFRQIGADEVLADRISDYDVEQLTTMVEDWEARNDDYGYIMEQQKDALKSKDKKVRDAAQKKVDEAQQVANDAFVPIEEYIEGLNVKYGIESEEPFEGAIPTPQVDKPRYEANRKALIDAYKSGDPAAITAAAQAIQQYVDEGLDNGEDNTEMFDIAEDYDGNDPEKLADQYIIRTFWDRYLDDDVDQEYIKTGLKADMRQPATEKHQRNEQINTFDELVADTDVTVTDPAMQRALRKIVDKVFKHGSTNFKTDKRGFEYTFVYLADATNKSDRGLLQPFESRSRVEYNDNNPTASWVDEKEQRVYFIKYNPKDTAFSFDYIIAGYKSMPKPKQPIGKTSTAEEIVAQEAQVDTTPTEAQKEAGNYQKGHINIDGYGITIENPKGSTRSGIDAQGNRWETEMHNTYGYIRGTEGVDGDNIDVFLSDDPASGSVFVVDQVNPSTGEFDEHKVMYGFPDMASAKQAYLSNYSKDWKGLGAITPVSREEFKKWVESSNRKTKPFAEYKSVKPQGDVQVGKNKPAKEHKRIVSDEKMEDLRKQLLAKFNNMNEGIDVERMLLGAMYAVGKIERGVTKFADYAAQMVDEIGEAIRPYLKAFYNAVRDMPEAAPYRDQMDSAEYVDKFDVFNFDKQKQPTAIEKAEQVVKQQKAKKQVKKIIQEQPTLWDDMFAETDSQPTEQEKAEPKREPAKRKTAWWNDPNRPQSLDPSDYHTYTTDEAKAYFAQFKSEDGKTDFTKWAHPNLAYITAAAWDGANIPLEELMQIAEIQEAERRVAEKKKLPPFAIPKQERKELAIRLLDTEHGSAVFENGKIKKVNGKEVFTGPVRQEKKAFVVVGRPAGGKSSVFANRLSHDNSARIVDSDVVKPWLSGYDEGYGAGYVQPVSAGIAKSALAKASDAGDNIVLPRIGGDGVMDEVIMLREKGYDVQIFYNEVSEQTSIMRAASRFAQEGRYLSLDYLTKIKHKDSKSFRTFVGKKIGDYYEQTESTRPSQRTVSSSDVLAGRGSEPGSNREDLRRGDFGRGGSSDVSGVVSETGRFGRAGQERPAGTFEEELIFSYAEWKSNDVAFGEKPKEIWNSNSGKPMPTIKTENDGVQSEQRLSGEPSSSGEGERENRGAADGDRAGLGSEPNRTEHVRSEHSVTQQPAQPKQAPKHNNKRNNSGERGKDYAPTSPKARFNANVEAIKMMRELIDQGIEAPTKDQMEVLRQYSGWGGLGTYFNDETTAENKILRDLLDDEEYNDAVMSINSAYYTPATVIDTLWDVAKAMGFKGGNVLEGSAGIGNIIGQMPKDMSRQSNIEAVEIDKISGNILKLLYPDAKVHIQGFQDTVIRNGSVDLAVTNVPFVTGLHVIDKVDKDLSRRFVNIHDFCIAKNIRKLREGGIGIFITSSGTLDKSTDLRAWITDEGQADVVGAFRLNNETFGGTKVTSDIIVVRKRIAGRTSEHSIDVSKASPVRVGTYEDKLHNEHQATMVINDYFKEHPEMMAGEMAFGYEKDDTFRPGSYGLYPAKGKDQDKMMAQFVKSMEATKEEREPVGKTTGVVVEPNQLTAVKEGRMLIDDKGRLCVSRYGEAVPLGINDQKVKGYTKQQCFKDYQAVQAAVDDVLQQQLNDPNDEALKPKLAALNKAYDLFTKRYGTLHKNTAISFLRNDIDFPSFQALEIYKEEKDIKGNVKVTTSKPKLFSERVIGFKTEPQPKTVKDAVIASIFRTNGIDLEWITNKLNEVSAPPHGDKWTTDDVRKGILVSRLGFEDPSTGQLEIRYRYLSGNVREKLAIAEQYNAEGETAGRYAANVEELRKVVPMDIPAHLIDFSLGSSWIPVVLYKDFVKETLDLGNVRITHLEGSWAFDEGYSYRNEKNRAAGVYSEKFRETIYGHQLVAAALNNRPVKVAKQVSEGYGSSKTTHTEVDQAATQACAVRVDEIKDEFKQWAKKKMQDDPELGRRIEKLYNEKFNALVPMEVGDEFLPERFEGANTGITLRPHQKLGAIKGLIAPTMLAHEVGTGKSFTLITTAMEMRRLGTAKKPMIVVQNATVAQMTADAKLLYPNAKVLSLSEQDRDAEGRRAFYAKIKYNDWDFIIVPQSTFERIPDSPERELQFIQEKIDEKKHVIEAAQAAGVDGQDLKRLKRELEKIEQEYGDVYLDNDTANQQGKKKKKDAKREAASLDKAETRAKEQLDRAVDDVQYFDDLGVDALLVDEAHEYKHLGFQTSIGRGIKGIDPSYSKKCAGLYNKTRSVFEKAGWKNVVFATGTPISNTAAEIWTFMKYLMPADVMKANDIYYFDDFVHNFGSISQMLEFATNGKFKENTRFAAYVNKPELIRIWSQVADTVRSADTDVKNKEPDLEGGKDQDIFLPQSPSLIRIMAAVRAELERFENMSGQQKKENSSIPLTMYGVAKRAAIDPRLVDAKAPDEPKSKTNAAVAEIVKDLKATQDYKGTVAVFCDNQNRLGVNAMGKKVVEFNIYDDMKEKLIKAGVPEKQIAIIKSGMSITAKQKIFDAVNSGDIRVVLGSTQTLGTGVNIQERLHLLIHMDAPDRPMDYTQRNGRIKRQGNLHKNWGKTIRVIRFGVEDSLDVTAYQRLKTKSGFIDSIMDGKAALANNQVDRTVEEEEEGLFDNPVAVLSGSQYALKKNQAERELRKYQGKKAQWEADQIYVTNQLRHNANEIGAYKAHIEDEQKTLDKIKGMFPDGTVKTITVEGVKIDMTKDDGAKKLGEVLKEKINDPVNAIVKRNRENAFYNDETLSYTISLDGHDVKFTVQVQRDSVWDNGRMKTVIHKFTSYSWPELNMDSMESARGVRDYLDELLDQVVTGRDSQDRIDAMQQAIERTNAETDQIQKRVGMPFQYDKELAEAQKNVEEYTELMKKEMKEKEAKYAAQQKEAEADGNGFDLSKAEDEEDDDERYRDQDVFVEGESFPINTTMGYSSYNVLDRTATYSTDLLPDAYTSHEEMLDAIRRQYPAYYARIEDGQVVMESWQHVFGAADAARQRKDKGSKSYVERKTRNAVNAVQSLAKQMHLDVEVLTTTDGLEGKKARAKGWFNRKTGKIVLVLPNHSSQGDLINTLQHEGVAHYGLRHMFGQHFDAFLDNVYNNVSPEIKARIDAAMKRNKWSRYEATEEYLARLAEQTDFEHATRMGWWQKIKDFFMHMLANVGLVMDEPLTDNELRYILWRSYDNLLHPDRRRNIFDKAREVQMQSRLRVGPYSERERMRIQRTGKIDTSRIAAEKNVPMYAEADVLIDDVQNSNVKTVEQGLSIGERVSELPQSQLVYAYNKVNGMMLDEDGLNVDEHNEKVKSDWIKEHGLEGVGKAMADDLKALMEKYGEGMLTLRWELLDRIENLGVPYEAGRTASEGDRVNEEMLNPDFEGKSSQELLLSLSQKDENGRNETINELVRRVREGDARIVRMGREIQYQQGSDSQIAGVLCAGWQLGVSAQSNEALGGMVRSSSTVEGRPTSARPNNASDYQHAIISWAKATGHYFDEEQVKKASLDNDVWRAAAESRVYRTSDGKKVIKFTETYSYYENPLLKRMDGIALHNAAGFEPITVLGYAEDSKGHLLTVVEQDYVDGVTIDDIFDDEPLIKVNNYLDDFIEEELGLQRHIDEDGDLYHTKDRIIYKDIHGANVLLDKNRKHHVIDCYVSLADDDKQERTGDFSIEDNTNERYSIRTKEAPKKTGTGYKVFVLKDGELYPPMVANPNGEGTPVGVWLDADAAPVAGTSKTGRPQVKAGGKGTQGGSGQLAYRPGWHLGTIPYALQFGRKDANGERTLFPNNFVWAEVEYADDVDYQDEARQEGVNANGKYQHSLAGLKHVPTDGSYKYRTNPDPRTDEWIISGAMRVKKILTRAEVDELVRKAGREPQQVQDGDIVTDDAVKKLNDEIKATMEADEMGLLYRDDDAWVDDVAKDAYEKAVAQEGVKLKEAWQDSMVALKLIQNAIAKETGRVATGAEDAYNFENRMHGRAKNMTEQYDWNYYRPMLKSFADFCKEHGYTQEQGLEYLISKSGLERNMYYAMQSAVREQLAEDAKKQREQLEKDYAKGKIPEQHYKDKKAEIEDMEKNGVDDAIKAIKDKFLWKKAQEDYDNGLIDYGEMLRRREMVIGSVAPKYVDYAHDYSGLTETFAKEMYDSAQEIKKEAQRAIDPQERRMLWSEYDEAMRQAYEVAREYALDAVFSGEHGDFKETSTKLWSTINAATEETLKQSYESGMMDRNTYNKVRGMFDYYIPLRGWDEDKASDVYTYMGKDNVFSPAVKKAWGRTSKAENPLAYIGNIAVSTIIAGHRNLMKQHFLNYVMNNPTSLVSISESWYENIGSEDDHPVWILRSADTAGKSGDELAQIINDFNEEMRLKQAEGKAMPVTGRLRLDVHATSGQKNEHVVEVQRAGHTYQLYINGNPKAAQALNGSAARAVSRISDTWLGKKITKLNRNMAMFFTSKNPAFVISNLSRDLNMAGASVAINEGAKYNANFVTNVIKVLAPRMGESSKWMPASKQPTGLMPSLMRKWQNGTLDESNETERLFKEFMTEGGETGFVNMLSIDSFKEKMQKEIREMNGSSLTGAKGAKETSIHKGLRLLGDTFEFYNRCAEDATRFIVYMTSRQMGKTLEESIADAKNVTLNFNRKGTGAKGNAEVRDLFIFVNPAIQALANMYRMAKGHPLKFGAVTAAFVAGGALMPIINQWLINMFGDDDDKDSYWNLPPWVRKNNLVFWVPGTKNFVTIPLSQEFRVFYGIGEMASSLAMEHPINNWELELFSSVADLVPINPTGNGGNLLVDFAPTIVQPIMQIGENVDFTGKPIWRDNQGNKYDPMFAKAYVSTPKWMTNISEGINYATGGDQDSRGWLERTTAGTYLNNPAVWNHLLQGYFGGMYNTIAKAFDVTATAASGEMPKIYQTPIINRFLNRPVERDNAGALGEDYWQLVNEMEETQHNINAKRKRAADGDKEAKIQADELMESSDGKRADVIRHYKSIIDDLRKGERSSSDKEEKKQFKESIAMYKQQMLEELQAIDAGVDPLDAAMQQFDKTTNLAERKKLLNRIKRLTSNADRTKGHNADVEKAKRYLDSESDEPDKAADYYLKLATSADIKDDARITAAKARAKVYADHLKHLETNGKGEEAAAYRQANAQWLAADAIIKNQSRLMSQNKKLLGKGHDQAVMKLIANNRNAMLKAIEGLPSE